jgi:predicted peptidase
MRFLSRSLILDNIEYLYQIYLPPDYGPNPSPIILALHGGGERGQDGQRQTEVGLGSVLRQNPDRYPSIVLFPQVPMGETWQGLGARVAIAALDQAIAEFNVDLSRVYLTGLSMGGNGTWYLAYRHPERFAAMVVICGWISARQGRSGVGFAAIASGNNPFASVAARCVGLPIWIFHGDGDLAVSVEESRSMVVALKAVGAKVEYTEFPGVGHRAWDQAYGMVALSDWLFQQTKSITLCPDRAPVPEASRPMRCDRPISNT